MVRPSPSSPRPSLRELDHLCGAVCVGAGGEGVRGVQGGLGGVPGGAVAAASERDEEAGGGGEATAAGRGGEELAELNDVVRGGGREELGSAELFFLL